MPDLNQQDDNEIDENIEMDQETFKQCILSELNKDPPKFKENHNHFIAYLQRKNLWQKLGTPHMRGHI